jgi:hypothetical protein
MLRVRPDLEGEEVAEVKTGRCLKLAEHFVGLAAEVEIVVLSGLRAFEA